MFSSRGTIKPHSLATSGQTYVIASQSAWIDVFPHVPSQCMVQNLHIVEFSELEQSSSSLK